MTKIYIPALLSLVLPVLITASCAETSKPTPDIKQGNPEYTTLYDVFSRYDTNSDNLLDRHEFFQFQQDPEIIAFRERIPEAARTIPLLFEEIDEDDDERISLDEITVIAEGYIPKIE